MAERQGFEPWVTCATTVFKTVPFNRSGISPWYFSKNILMGYFYNLIIKMAPPTGFEPVTKWLTAIYSTAELRRNTYIILKHLFIVLKSFRVTSCIVWIFLYLSEKKYIFFWEFVKIFLTFFIKSKKMAYLSNFYFYYLIHRKKFV